jgi:hypothetical protein
MLNLDLLDLFLGDSLHLLVLQPFQFLFKETLLSAVILGLLDLLDVFDCLLEVHLSLS